MVVLGGGEEAEYVGTFRVLQDSNGGKLVQVDLAVNFVFLLVFVGGKTITAEDKPAAFPVLENPSINRVKGGWVEWRVGGKTDGSTFVLRFLLFNQPLLITLSIWKDPSCSTATGAVLIRMRSCGGCSRSRWANVLGITVDEGEIGERTSAVDMTIDAAEEGLGATVVARCSCPDGERGRSVEEPASRAGDGGKESRGRYTTWGEEGDRCDDGCGCGCSCGCGCDDDDDDGWVDSCDGIVVVVAVVWMSV